MPRFGYLPSIVPMVHDACVKMLRHPIAKHAVAYGEKLSTEFTIHLVVILVLHAVS